MTITFRITVFMILAAVVVPLPTTTNHVGSLKDEIKCGDCPCGTTCYSSPPPPKQSPPPPPPPPKQSPPPPPPPPPPKKPSSIPCVNCPPPPKGGGGGGGQAPPDNIYVTGPPKDLYPVGQIISAARRSFTVAPPVLVLSGLLALM